MKKEISIIMPTINEESIFKLIDDIKKGFGNKAEIIVVDKSDESYYKRLVKKNVIVIKQQDSGYENAIMLGFKKATGKYLATIDPDGTYPYQDLVNVYNKIKKDNLNAVFGNRFGGLSKGSMQNYIRFGNKSLTSIYQKLYNPNIKDVLTGVFIFDRKAFNIIKDATPYRAGTAFFAIEFARHKLNIGEISILYLKRINGKSKLSKSKLFYGFGVAGHMVRYIRDYSPLLIFGLIGSLPIISGIIVGIFVVSNYIATGTLMEVGRALISFMLLVIGFLFIITGLILDMLRDIKSKLKEM